MAELIDVDLREFVNVDGGENLEGVADAADAAGGAGGAGADADADVDLMSDAVLGPICKNFFIVVAKAEKPFDYCALCYPFTSGVSRKREDEPNAPKLSLAGVLARASGGSAKKNLIAHLRVAHGARAAEAVQLVTQAQRDEWMRAIKAAQDAKTGCTSSNLLQELNFVKYNGVQYTKMARLAMGLAAVRLQFASVEDARFRDCLTGAPPKDARTVAVHTREAQAILVDAHLKALQGLCVTIALDKGTVAGHDYMAVCLIVVDPARPQVNRQLCIELEPRGKFYATGYTAENVQTHIRSTISTLRAFGIRVIGIVTDNASNMRAATRAVQEAEGAMAQPCMCHTAQLVVHDVLEHYAEPWAEAIESCKQMRRDMMNVAKVIGLPHLPEANDTRWNSTRLLLLGHIDRRNVLPAAFRIPDEHARTAKRIVVTLRPLHVFTDRMQRDDASVLDAIVNLDLILSVADGRAEALRDKILCRMSGSSTVTGVFMSIPLMLITFFMPLKTAKVFSREYGVDGTIADYTDARTHALSTMKSRACIEFVRHVIPSKFVGAAAQLELEFKKMDQGYKRSEETMTASQIREFLNSESMNQKFPLIFTILRAMCNIAASEAMCERAFSVLGFVMVDRDMMSEENAEACLLVNMLSRVDLSKNQPARMFGENEQLGRNAVEERKVVAARESERRIANEIAEDENEMRAGVRRGRVNDDAMNDEREPVLTLRVANWVWSAAIEQYRRACEKQEKLQKKCSCEKAWKDHTEEEQEHPLLQCCMTGCHKLWVPTCAVAHFNIMTRVEDIDVHSWMCPDH